MSIRNLKNAYCEKCNKDTMYLVRKCLTCGTVFETFHSLRSKNVIELNDKYGYVVAKMVRAGIKRKMNKAKIKALGKQGNLTREYKFSDGEKTVYVSGNDDAD